MSGSSSSSSSLGAKGKGKGNGVGVVPDGGDREAEEVLPQAVCVAHYVNRRMRYDTFLQLRDMLAA
jgi:hypothetical protein